MADRETTETEQQRLDRYKQRRDEYIRELVDSAPPLSEEQKAELAGLLPRRQGRPGGRRHDQGQP